MDLKEYQIKSRETAVYPDVGHNLQYPSLGLLGEVGEIAEKVKKVHRDKAGLYSSEDIRLLQKECGDVAWYLSQYVSELGIDLAGCDWAEYTHGTVSTEETVIRLGVEVGRLLDPQAFSSSTTCVGMILLQLRRLCTRLGIPLETVLQENVNKLQSRKERGVLKGSGDDR